MSQELQVLKSAIDLAASKRSGESIEWLALSDILQSFNDVCFQLKLKEKDPQLEHRCYHILLLMSADTENGWTWWEKLEHVNKYIYSLSKQNHPAAEFHKTTMLEATTSAQKPRSMKLVSGNASRSGFPAARASTVSASLMQEGVELSGVLNSRRITTAEAGRRSEVFSPGTSNMLNNLNDMSTPQRSSPQKSRARYSESRNRAASTDLTSPVDVNELIERISSIEKETRKTHNILADLTYRKQTKERDESLSRINMTSTHINEGQSTVIDTVEKARDYQDTPKAKPEVEQSKMSPVQRAQDDDLSAVADALRFGIESPGLSPPKLFRDHGIMLLIFYLLSDLFVVCRQGISDSS